MIDVADQIDAMLHGWLEHAAQRRRPGRPGARVTAVLPSSALSGLRDLRARWDLSVDTRGAIALVSGPARVVEGLVAVTGMARG
ncbi:MAG TPA: hypothetical protein VFM58_17690 [Solirubrobacteraceae bacterium]|nr:hypothetical protein [Solirubrobacteraceae bacterium]